jgi:BlaI family penicillinase repressor
MLARLVEKGALKFEVDGPRYVYRPAVTRKRCVREEGRSFLDRVFKGDVGSLLLHYVSEAKIDADDLEALRRALDEKLKEQG